MGPYTIGQLARAVGVPTSTVRYYERARLLRPDGRTGGNYRVYGDAALERLRFIRAAQANGFTLDDISVLLSFRDGATTRCKEVQGLIRDRLADLRKRMEQMHEVEVVLRSSLKMCRQFERTGRCQVIDSLKRAATSSPPKKARRRSSS
jgi:MerR family mercuric resistance operon transcriptional regulator